MSSDKKSDAPVPDYDLLFKKVLFKNSWDEITSKRATISSQSPNSFLPSKLELDQSSEPRKNPRGSALCAFIPSLIRCNVGTSSNQQRIAMSEDSLEDLTTLALEMEGNEESEEIEEATLDGTQTAEEELENEERSENEDDNPVGYLDKQVFPILLPCLEKMLFAAKEHDVLKVQKSRFNGLDYLAELLWNQNPLHPERHSSHVPIFNIPFVQKHLEETPRPIIPQSWLWTRDQAAIVIQSAIRGYLVRCQPEVQELRQFWKTLAEEK